MTVHEKLLAFTMNIAYPYIMKLEFLQPYLDEISVLLVGSTATGLCGENSDVDICLLCHHDVFKDISKNTNWMDGRPTEIIMKGTQLHYYVNDYDTIVERLNKFDDVSFYIHGTAIPLNDTTGLFAKLSGIINDPELNQLRKDKAIDMLVRRNRAMSQILSDSDDPVLRLNICVEIIEHILKTTALADGLQFDSRKRLYRTALKGELGGRLKGNIDCLISLISNVSCRDDIDSKEKFIKGVDFCMKAIQEA